MPPPFEPPAGWTRVRTIDAHTAGEPLRVIVEGVPEPEGDTILAKRRFARERLDGLRRALMLEPRGHADMYGALPVAPVTPDGDLGVLFLHNEGWSTMCGHGVIALVKVGLECGLLAPRDPGPERARTVVRLDTPAGRVTATAYRTAGGAVERVVLENVPSFLAERDLEVDVEGLGRVRCDLAYGGAFYALVDARALDVRVEPARVPELVALGVRIQRAVAVARPIAHPEGDPDLGFLYGVILSEPSSSPGVHSRNVCVFADGEVDRSPTGTGVSARVAALVARGEAALGERLTIESVLGTRFDVRALRETSVGGVAAVVPEVTGTAHLTGRHEFWIDPDDPLRAGFRLGAPSEHP